MCSFSRHCLTLESLIYVIVGIILGMVLYRLLAFYPRRWLGGDKKQQPAY